MKPLLYVLCLVIAFLLIDIVFDFLLDNALFQILNWFNQLPLFWIFAIFIAGGTGLLFISLKLMNLGSAYIAKSLSKICEPSAFNTVIAICLYLANTIWSITIVWQAIPHFGFLITIEFIVICLYILIINATLIQPGKLSSAAINE